MDESRLEEEGRKMPSPNPPSEEEHRLLETPSSLSLSLSLALSVCLFPLVLLFRMPSCVQRGCDGGNH
jgi:hypothetical protein